MYKFWLNLIGVIILIAIGFLLAVLVIPEKVKIKTKTKTEKIEIRITPTPVYVEKIIYKDGKVSFSQEVPFESTISTPSVDVAFSGTNEIIVDNNFLKVNTKVDSNAKVTLRIPEKPVLKNEAGLFYDGETKLYYKREFDKILWVNPWVGVDYNLNRQELKFKVGLGIPF